MSGLPSAAKSRVQGFGFGFEEFFDHTATGGAGAAVFEGHRAENISGAEVVVTSSAIAGENPEVVEAHSCMYR